MKKHSPPPLFHIAFNYIVTNIQQATKDFTRPFDLPVHLAQEIVKKRLASIKSKTEANYLITNNAPFVELKFSSNLVSKNWINSLPELLVRLDASNAKITLFELPGLKRLKNLKELKLNGCIHVLEDEWPNVISSTQLEVLDVSGTQFGDKALAKVANSCPNMTALNLSATRVFKAIQALKKLPNLTDLNLTRSRVPPTGLIEAFNSFIQLTRLQAEFYDLSQFTEVYRHLPVSLKTLRLTGCPGADQHSNMQHLTALQRIDLSCVQRTAFSIENLTNLTRISFKNAEIRGAQEYDWSKMKYVKAKYWDAKEYPQSLLHCKEVQIQKDHLPGQTHLATLRINVIEDLLANNGSLLSLSNLRKLVIGKKIRVDYRLIAPYVAKIGLRKLESRVPLRAFPLSLEKLKLYSTTAVPLDYSRLINLTSLTARAIPFEHIVKLTKLQYLDIRGPYYKKINPWYLSSLQNLTQLRMLGVDLVKIQKQWLFGETVLFTSLTKLKVLNLYSVSVPLNIQLLNKLDSVQVLTITDDRAPLRPETINKIKKLPSLKELHISANLISSDGLAELKRSKSLNVVWLIDSNSQSESKAWHNNNGV